MATTTQINNKQVRLSIEAKARLLDVIEIGEAGVLAVRSGSDPTKGYAVRHNNKCSTSCPCGARTPRCSHRIAVDWHLEAQRRAAYEALFDLSYAGGY